jgi:hypothetical protein
MTRRADFNAEEWTTVVDGPIYAGLRVIGASHCGRLRESLALARTYQEARANHGESESGGFLGIGGKQITDAENQALDEISSALGPPRAA